MTTPGFVPQRGSLDPRTRVAPGLAPRAKIGARAARIPPGAALARRAHRTRPPLPRAARFAAMQSGESIYALIPPPEVAEERPPMHRSQHVGAVDPRDFGMPPKRANATMGRVPGALKPKTERFLRSRTRDATNVGGASPAGALTRGARSPPRNSPLPNLDDHRLPPRRARRRDGPAPPPPTPRPGEPSRREPRAPRRAVDRVAEHPRRARARALRHHPDPSPPLTHPPTHSPFSRFSPSYSAAAASNGASTRAKTKTKPAVPKAHERPSTWEMTGLHSDKDFVTANALECILAKPEKPAPPKLATEKAEYGKVPAYLETIKAQIAAERTMLAERRRAEEEAALGSVREMTEEERDDLLFDLKTKWGKLNAAYGRLSFSLDVPSHRRKKESLEREMTQLEKDVKQLQGRQVVVLEDGR